MRYIFFIFIFLCACPLLGQHIINYDMDVAIDVRSKTIDVDAVMTFDAGIADTTTFILWRNTRFTSVESAGKPLSFTFDTTSPSPIMYIYNGRKLFVRKSAETNQIRLRYTSDLSTVNGKWEGVFSDDCIEMAMYCGWYPFELNSYDYTADIRVRIDSGYVISGSGIVSKQAGYWELKKPWKSFDLVLDASPKMKTKVFEEGTSRIQIDYQTLTDSASDSVLTEVRYVFGLFERIFGPKDSLKLKFVIPPMRLGGGYSRKYFVVMPGNELNSNLRAGIAHEISHFWWFNAPTTSWEDWLNEAFAEYSTLRYIRERLGADEFRKRIDEYRADTKNLSPLWGIDRNHNDAYNILYLKGSLILCDLETRMGTGKFDALLRHISEKKISSTDSLLHLVAADDSIETSAWLEKQLRTR